LARTKGISRHAESLLERLVDQVVYSDRRWDPSRALDVASEPPCQKEN
jgi:hypothetical protein